MDEIVLTLDDNAMNLQSMSASRYVGPFLEKVQKWEKSLSHISETVDVSFTLVCTCRDFVWGGGECVILYSGNFLWGPIFVVFAVDWQSTKIKHVKLTLCWNGRGLHGHEELLLLLRNSDSATDTTCTCTLKLPDPRGHLSTKVLLSSKDSVNVLTDH